MNEVKAKVQKNIGGFLNDFETIMRNFYFTYKKNKKFKKYYTKAFKGILQDYFDDLHQQHEFPKMKVMLLKLPRKLKKHNKKRGIIPVQIVEQIECVNIKVRVEE